MLYSSKIYFYCFTMNLFFYSFLFIFGTLFGSFASVLVYRLKSGEGGIMTGRSHCKICSRDLSALELIPIVSWIIQKWKCKGCKQKISPIYPALELVTWFLFAAVWYFMIDPTLIFSGDILEIGRLFFFLSIIFLTVVYSFYDILFLEIPESILLIANIWTFGALILQSLSINIFPFLPLWGFDIKTLVICFFVLCTLYFVFLAGLKDIYDVIIISIICVIFMEYIFFTDARIFSSPLLSGTGAALGIYLSFFLQIIVSGWRWMWAWDLRIAILMWLLVWASFAFPAWMLCYIIGSILGVGVLISQKIKKSTESGMNMQVPFGPFIASGYLCILFFHPEISSFIAWYF